MSFENFPYVNFHELNLDWIAKIAKDFLEQYTHIQELIANGEQSLQDLTASGLADLQAKADALEQLLQEWYDTHSADIANELAAAIQSMGSELNRLIGLFNSEAEGKTEDLLASIPDNYSALSDKVNTIQQLTLRKADSTNIFNKLDVTYGGLYYSASGQYMEMESYCYSDLIPINPLTYYYVSQTAGAHFCYYNSNREYVTGVSIIPATTQPIRTPADIAFLRISIPINELSDFHVNEGEFLFPYESYNEAIVTPEELTLNNLVRNFNKTNIFDKYKITKGGVRFSGTGAFVATSEADCFSDYIEVTPGNIYEFDVFTADEPYAFHVAWYNENKTYLSGFSGTQDAGYFRHFTAPENARYCTWSLNTNLVDKAMMSVVYNNNFFNPAYIPYWISITNNGERFKGKKCAILGDSISFGVGDPDYISDKTKLLRSYANLFANMTGMVITNLAINGATLTAPEVAGSRPSIIANEIPSLPTDLDYVIIFAGTNDYWLQIPVGDSSSGNTTFRGALAYIMQTIPARCPNAQIVFITPYTQWRNDITIEGVAKDPANGYNSNMTLNNANLKTFRDLIIEYASAYSMPVLDLYSLIENPIINAYKGVFTAYGDVHPNMKGHALIANILYNFFLSNL